MILASKVIRVDTNCRIYLEILYPYRCYASKQENSILQVPLEKSIVPIPFHAHFPLPCHAMFVVLLALGVPSFRVKIVKDIIMMILQISCPKNSRREAVFFLRRHTL
jgi:hypothetical protein